MQDDERDALLTPRGREEKLRELEGQVDGLVKRVEKIEGKEATRDKRWDWAIRSFSAVAGGIIVSVVVALVQSGVHL